LQGDLDGSASAGGPPENMRGRLDLDQFKGDWEENSVALGTSGGRKEKV